VTDEKAKAFAQPKTDSVKPAKQDRKTKPSPPPAESAAPAEAKPPAEAKQPDAAPAEPDGKRKVRSVGPQFYPVR